MPATEYQGSSSSPFASIGRSILSIRRDQVHSMDGHHEGGSSQEQELDAFQRHVAELFQELSGAGPEELLSLPWLRKLLDAFLICQEEFRVVLFNSKSAASRPPLDRLIAEFFERGVKALDVCNAVRDGVDQVRQWRRHLDIVVAALGHAQRALGEGQLRRAKKALTDLSISMLDEKDGAAGSSAFAHRNRSFGRSGKDHHGHSHSRVTPGGHFRSLSWSVSRSWSAARQLQAIGNNLNAPRGNEVVATGGLAIPVFTMNSVLLFVMWALVAAIPCQDRGLQTHLSVPRSFTWAASVMSLHERILEESKKRDRKNSTGLLREIHQIEKCTRHLSELTDAHFPLTEDKEAEIREAVQELSNVCDVMKEELELLERQVREVFHRIVRSRTEGLDCVSHNPE